MEAVSQYIDILGKCQLIQLAEKTGDTPLGALKSITLVIEPCAPFSLIESKPIIKKCKVSQLSTIPNFVVMSKTLDANNKIDGVWGTFDYFGPNTVYVPITSGIVEGESIEKNESAPLGLTSHRPRQSLGAAAPLSRRSKEKRSFDSVSRFSYERTGPLGPQRVAEEVGPSGAFTVPLRPEGVGGAIESIPISIKKPDINVFEILSENQSKLKTFEKNKRVAEILKHYTLYDYSLHPETNPEFVIVEKYTFKLKELNNRLFKDGNTIMYQENKLIVPSELVKHKLLHYLEAQLANDRQGVLNYAYKSVLSEFKTVADFQNRPYQNIFMNVDSLKKWIDQKETYKSFYNVHSTLFPDKQDPYFYKFQGTVILLQNVVEADWYHSAMISFLWETKHINYGFSPNKNIEKEFEKEKIELKAKEYSVKGIKSEKNSNCRIFRYDKEHFAAVLLPQI